MSQALLTPLALLLAVACIGTVVMVLRGDPTARRLEARLQGLAQPAESAQVAGRGLRRAGGGASMLASLLQRVGRSPHIPPSERYSLLALLLAVGVAGAAAGALASQLLNVAVGPAAALLAAALTARTLFGMETQRWRDRLFEQIPGLMSLILRAIRAGLPVSEAMANAAREVEMPTRDEFSRVVSAVSIGQPVEEALFALADRSGLAEHYFFAVTVSLQSSTGGNLGETLENLAEMVRRRVAMAARVKAITAEGRTSAGIMALLPIVAALGLAVLVPGYLDPMLDPARGLNMLLSGLALLATGLLVIRALLRNAVKD